MVRRFALALLFLGSLGLVEAETVRGPIVDIIVVNHLDDGATERALALDEMLAIDVDTDPRFLKGIEIEVRVPSIVRSQPGTVSAFGLVSVTPAPEQRVMSLRGAKVFEEPLLRSQRVYYQVPTAPDAGLRSSASTVVLDRVVPVASFPLLFGLTEISKSGATPRSSTEFEVSVRPLLRDLGGVRLQVVTEDGSTIFPGDQELDGVQVRINGEVVSDVTSEVLLEPGLHSLELVSETYLESSRTFGVERGEITEIRLSLVRPKATVRLETPEGALVYVDGVQIQDATVELEEGEHVAVVRVGDYSVSRRFTVARKKRYIISVTLDILVNEVE